MSGRKVAIVGGGIAGLAAAHLCSRRWGVVVFEAGDRLGGKLRTGEIAGRTVEDGADSFVARDDAVVGLCAEVGLGEELVAPAVFGAHVWFRGKLRPLPPGLTFGVPSVPSAGIREGLVGLGGALRAAADLASPRPLTGPDVAVGSFLRGRLGAQVLDRLVDPLLAGTRAGDPDRMSLAAALPQIDAAARTNRSLMRGLAKARRSSGGSPRFLATRGGMEALPRALRDSATGVQWRTSEPVLAIARGPGGFSVRTASRTERVGAVIVATPVGASAGLLHEVAPEAARELAALSYARVAIVTLAYDSDPPGIPNGTSGMLVPRSEGRTLAAATWFSRKWPERRAPGGPSIVRAFVGRAASEGGLDMDDTELVPAVRAELSSAIGAGAPVAARVHRWDEGLPQYEVGHLERIARVEASLAKVPGLAVAGSAYRGPGISDCVRSAVRAVEKLERDLAGTATPRAQSAPT